METEQVIITPPTSDVVEGVVNEHKEAAYDAVEAAIAASESGKSPDEAVEAGLAKAKSKEAPKDDPAKSEPAAESDLLSASQLKKVLAAREAKVKAIQEANSEKQAILAEVAKQRAEAEQMVKEARAQAEYFRKLKTDPEAAMRALGVDPEEWLTNIANSASPEAKLQAQLRAQREELQRFQAQQTALEKQREEYAKQAQAAQQQQFRGNVVQQFMDLVDKTTYTKALYGHQPDILKAWGDQIADEYREATALKFGRPQEATLEEIAEYIEEQSQLRYNSLKLESGKVGTSVAGHQAPSGKAAKTLGQSDSSEKRALSRNLDDLDEAERRLAAIEEAERAISQYESNQK